MWLGPCVRRMLKDRRQPYVLAKRCNYTLRFLDEWGLVHTVLARMAQAMPADERVSLAAGEGANGPRLHDWARVRLGRAFRSLLRSPSVLERPDLRRSLPKLVTSPADGNEKTIAKLLLLGGSYSAKQELISTNSTILCLHPGSSRNRIIFITKFSERIIAIDILYIRTMVMITYGC